AGRRSCCARYRRGGGGYYRLPQLDQGAQWGPVNPRQYRDHHEDRADGYERDSPLAPPRRGRGFESCGGLLLRLNLCKCAAGHTFYLLGGTRAGPPDIGLKRGEGSKKIVNALLLT